MAAKRRTIDPGMLENVTNNMFHVLPLLRKRMFHLDVVQSEHGIPFSHVQVLAMLDDVGTMSVSEISRGLGIAKPNITPLVDRLITAGLVERSRDSSDRRVVNVVILPAGRERLTAVRESISKQVGEWAEELRVADFVELNESLESLTRILGMLRA